MKTNAITQQAHSCTVTKTHVNKSGIIGILAAALLMLMLIPYNVMASRERFVLDFNDSHIAGYKGDSATLFLKRSLKQQYPHVRISDMDLRKVVLVAKSKLGRGGAQLRVGDRRTGLYRVDGHPASFRDHRKYSFDRIRLHNPSRDSFGPWQVNLKGNFIVRKVVLVVEDHSRSRHHKGWRHHYNW